MSNENQIQSSNGIFAKYDSNRVLASGSAIFAFLYQYSNENLKVKSKNGRLITCSLTAGLCYLFVINALKSTSEQQ